MSSEQRDISARLNPISEAIIGAAIEVHRGIGPGLLERVYAEALHHELTLRGIGFAREVPIEIEYKGLAIRGQRADLVVSGSVVVELKAVEEVADVHLAQLVSYMRAGGFPLGLLLNFHVPVMTKGIYRRINSAFSAPSASPRSNPPSPRSNSEAPA